MSARDGAGSEERAPAGETVPAAEPLPNLLLIIADDLAWNDSSAYGHAALRTPHLARLAREGLRFDRAYVTASSCSPSRASLLTSRFPHNTGAEELHWPVPENQVTFVEKLREAGYWTGAAGKWHLGEAMKSRFDTVLAPGAKPKTKAGEPGDSAKKSRNRKNRDPEPAPEPPKPPDPSGCGEWVPLLKDRPKDKPFFVWLASFDPHRGYVPGEAPPIHGLTDVSVAPYLADTPETRGDLALYHDEIERLDSRVGEVLAELEAQGVLEQTLILFLSDNGRPFPREKTTLYEGGIRVPLLARWPGKIGQGKSCGSLVSSLDIGPTLLAAARVTGVPERFQGRSLLPLFEKPERIFRDYIFAEKNWHDYEDHARVVLGRRYKYIRNSYTDLPLTPPADVVKSPSYAALQALRKQKKLSAAQEVYFQAPRPREELYDLESDPWELENLAGDARFDPIRATLSRELDDWMKRTRDYVPSLRTADEYDRETGDPLENRRLPRPSKYEMMEAGLASP